jgi:hypothetical protein
LQEIRALSGSGAPRLARGWRQAPTELSHSFEKSVNNTVKDFNDAAVACEDSVDGGLRAIR